MRHARSVAAMSTLFLTLAVLPAFGQDAKPKAVSHDLEGKDQCMMCHSGAMEGIPAAPEDHEGRGNETCLMCHAPGAAIQTADAPPIPHDLEGKDQCTMCHSGAMEGIPAPPADHEGRANDACQLCHKPGA